MVAAQDQKYAVYLCFKRSQLAAEIDLLAKAFWCWDECKVWGLLKRELWFRGRACGLLSWHLEENKKPPPSSVWRTLPSILSLVSMTALFQFTEPLDRFFALLPLVKQGSSLLDNCDIDMGALASTGYVLSALQSIGFLMLYFAVASLSL